MSNITKTIIPLIDDGLDIEDFSDKTGFEAVYYEDINRPYLDNHIFFMYNWEDKRCSKIFYKFRSLKSFYGYRVVYIKDRCHIIYIFTSNSLINRIKRGVANLRDVNKVRILQFWGFKDAWITLNVMRGTITCDPPSDILPEEDFNS